MPDRNDDIKSIKEAMQDDYQGVQPEVRQDSTAAPLFVKVDKYREVLTGIQEMKIFLGGLRQIFTVMNEIEEMRMQYKSGSLSSGEMKEYLAGKVTKFLKSHHKAREHAKKNTGKYMLKD